MSEMNARVYRPDSRFATGWLSAVLALYRELMSFRPHIGTLFARDFEAAYRGAALGVFWNFALPLVPISAYIMLAGLRVFPAREGLPAAIYIGIGATLWFLMTGLIRQPISIVKSRTREVMKTALPLSASIASSFAMLLFETLVRLGLVVVLIVVFRSWPALTAPLLIPVAIIAATFGLSLGVFLSILNAVSPDIERLVTIVLQYGIFLSGVIFPVSSLGPLGVLEVANPFAVFITAARDAAFMGGFSHPIALAAWSGATLVLALVAARFFYVMEYRIRGLA